jgi:hypothetical protein
MSYLSIDLDYWRDTPTRHPANNFFKKVFALNVPMVLCKRHHWLVPDINKHFPEDGIVYNVDFHSDITGEDGANPRLNCGNWADFIKRRKEGHFIWVYPNVQKCYRESWGLCGTDRQPFEKSYSEWKRISRRQGTNYIRLANVERVGIAISPDYYTLDPIAEVLCCLLSIDGNRNGTWNGFHSRIRKLRKGVKNVPISNRRKFVNGNYYHEKSHRRQDHPRF